MTSNRYKYILHHLKYFLLVGFVLNAITLHAQKTSDDQVDIDKIPPRIIRACCAFGYDLKLWGVPFVNIDQVISVDDLGDHHYMGNKQEGIGTIYTNRGGFIDIGHVRDQMDWTRFLYTTILHHRGKGEVNLRLRKEAGRKTLKLNVPAEFDKGDCSLLAGKIAFDFSLWHEISTWFGASAIPFLPEKFSSFSVEDVYSNLLGIHIGMKTLLSEPHFNEAATTILAKTLDSLAVVPSPKETYEAYDAVHNLWYSNKKRIPHNNISLKRDPNVLTSSRPWIVPDQTENLGEPIVLEVPLLTTKCELLTNFYEFSIDLNRKLPVETLFPNRESSRINQDDFEVLLQRIVDEIKIMEENEKAEKKK